MISVHSVIAPAPDVLATNLGEDVVILNIASGVYYGLDSVGARVWQLVQEPNTVDKIHEAIRSEYDVETQQCERDVLSLLEELMTAGLVAVKNGASA